MTLSSNRPDTNPNRENMCHDPFGRQPRRSRDECPQWDILYRATLPMPFVKYYPHIAIKDSQTVVSHCGISILIARKTNINLRKWTLHKGPLSSAQTKSHRILVRYKETTFFEFRRISNLIFRPQERKSIDIHGNPLKSLEIH